jgi:hypothetical protein
MPRHCTALFKAVVLPSGWLCDLCWCCWWGRRVPAADGCSLLHCCPPQGGAGGAYTSLIRLHNRQNLSDRAMQTASREISATCERLRVTDAVKNSALEVYKDVGGRLAVHFAVWNPALAAIAGWHWLLITYLWGLPQHHTGPLLWPACVQSSAAC